MNRAEILKQLAAQAPLYRERAQRIRQRGLPPSFDDLRGICAFVGAYAVATGRVEVAAKAVSILARIDVAEAEAQPDARQTMKAALRMRRQK